MIKGIKEFNKKLHRFITEKRLKRHKNVIQRIYQAELKKNNKQSQIEKLETLLESIENFTKEADAVSKKIKDKKYTYHIYLYVLIKQVIAIFESLSAHIPIQLYNE